MTNHDSQPADTGQGGPRLHRFEDDTASCVCICIQLP